jgi:hypothetical protein
MKTLKRPQMKSRTVRDPQILGGKPVIAGTRIPVRLHIDLVFDQTQKLIWTADKESVGSAWVVNFSNGYCFIHPVDSSDYFVRAVRIGQSTT